MPQIAHEESRAASPARPRVSRERAADDVWAVDLPRMRAESSLAEFLSAR